MPRILENMKKDATDSQIKFGKKIKIKQSQGFGDYLNINL